MPDDDVVARMKHHVHVVLANISAMMPCFALNNSKLPKVTGEKADLLPALFCGMEPARPLCMATRPHLLVVSSPVSHHDAEIPFNPSFIESPSAAWASDSSFSSFDTDNEGPEYSVPPREGEHGSISPPCCTVPLPTALVLSRICTRPRPLFLFPHFPLRKDEPRPYLASCSVMCPAAPFPNVLLEATLWHQHPRP